MEHQTTTVEGTAVTYQTLLSISDPASLAAGLRLPCNCRVQKITVEAPPGWTFGTFVGAERFVEGMLTLRESIVQVAAKTMGQEAGNVHLQVDVVLVSDDEVIRATRPEPWPGMRVEAVRDGLRQRHEVLYSYRMEDEGDRSWRMVCSVDGQERAFPWDAVVRVVDERARVNWSADDYRTPNALPGKSTR